MPSPKHQFRINVGFIMHAEVGYSADFPYELESVQAGGDFPLRELAGIVHISRTAQGLLCEGEFDAQTDVECMRCLASFSQPLHWEFSEAYATNERSVTDSGLLVPDDLQLDIEPLLREYAILEVPIKAVCKPDCRGLCAECGQDLNRGDCGHPQGKTDSPFAGLVGPYDQ